MCKDFMRAKDLATTPQTLSDSSTTGTVEDNTAETSKL